MDLRWGMRNKLMGFGVLLHPKAPLMASVLEGPGLPDGGGVKGAGGGVGGGSKEPLMHLTWGIKEAAGVVEDGGV